MQINTLNSQINQQVGMTIEDAKNTLNTTQDQSAAMEELSATVQDTLLLAQRLRVLFEEQ